MILDVLCPTWQICLYYDKVYMYDVNICECLFELYQDINVGISSVFHVYSSNVYVQCINKKTGSSK